MTCCMGGLRTVHPDLPAQAPRAQGRVLPVVLHKAHLHAEPPDLPIGNMQTCIRQQVMACSPGT